MIDARFAPLATPLRHPTGGCQKSPFGASWKTTLDDLERELNHLKAKGITIEVDTTRDQIRNDGWPYSSARIASPGVRLSFIGSTGPLMFECATYSHWEANIRAICLTLERLRAVDRYGCVKRGEQYRGWSQLPPGGSIQAAEWASVEEAAKCIIEAAGPEFCGVWPGDVVKHPGRLKEIYGAAARRAHPDVGGSTELMTKVNRARDFIEAVGAN